MGLLGHSDGFYSKLFHSNGTELIRKWGQWLKASDIRVGGYGSELWFQEEGDDKWNIWVQTQGYG